MLGEFSAKLLRLISSHCSIRTIRFPLMVLVQSAISVSVWGAISGTTFMGEIPTPTFATYAPGDFGRLFVTQIDGSIRIIDLASHSVLDQPFLTIPDVDTSGEGGLLGLAFHPDYATNGKFYTLVTTGGPFTTRVREYQVSSDPNVATPVPHQIAEWSKMTDEHNAGWIGFNPAASSDKKSLLYITTGDDEQQDTSQSLDSPHGKVLRIDVDGDSFPSSTLQNYAIPASNPFAGGAPADDAIWSLGLRNPWRASFDRLTGDYWIGDVGADRIEEIDREPADSAGGVNYGWRSREGTEDYDGGPTLPNEQLPVYEYFHLGDECTNTAFCGNTAIGGYVYRGSDPDLYGEYVFTDFISNNYWAFDPKDPYGTVTRLNDSFSPENNVSSPLGMGEDAAGNLYILAGGGAVYRIDTDVMSTPADFDQNGTVDGRDFLAWQRGESPTPLSGADLALWQSEYKTGAIAKSATAVPEPRLASLLVTCVLLLSMATRELQASSTVRNTARISEPVVTQTFIVELDLG